MYEYEFKIRKTYKLRGIISKEKGVILTTNYEDAKQKLDKRIDSMQENNVKLEILGIDIHEIKESNESVYTTSINNTNIGKWN